MNTTFVRTPLRVLALVALVALAIGVAACGGSDGTTEEASAEEPRAAESQAAPPDVAAEHQILALMNQMQKAFAHLNGKKACSLMTSSAQEELASYGDGDCARGFEKIFTPDVVQEDLTPTDLEFDIDGDKASVSGYTSHTQDRQTAQFVKVDGKWKVQTWFTN